MIDFHPKKYSEGSEETTDYIRGTTQKLRSFCVNCVTSVENERELGFFIKEASMVFAEATFDLRGWEYSDPSLENHTNTVVLGLTWDRKADTGREQSRDDGSGSGYAQNYVIPGTKSV
jgi:hypothetical protein